MSKPGAEVVVFRSERFEEVDLVASALRRAGVPFERRAQADRSTIRSGPVSLWLIAVPPAAAERARGLLDGVPVTTQRVLEFRCPVRPSPGRAWRIAAALCLLLLALVFAGPAIAVLHSALGG